MIYETKLFFLSTPIIYLYRTMTKIETELICSLGVDNYLIIMMGKGSGLFSSLDYLPYIKPLLCLRLNDKY